MSRPFVHLHCHTHYSLLDGASPIDRLVRRAKDHGMNALAITDHGNLHGALDFYRQAKEVGINPIIGYEAYIAAESRFNKDSGGSKEASYHLTLLAKNRVGFQNLVKLASAAYLEGFYFKPRIDKELLSAHSEGLLCLSGCVSSEFNRVLLRGGSHEGNLEEACAIAHWFQSVFGERYFIEIQNNGLAIQRTAMDAALEVAEKSGIPLVATSDAHYVDRQDAEAQDVLLCINTGRFRTDTNRMRMEGDQFYLRAPEEMYEAFPGQEEAVARSQEIADSVDIELELGKRHFPGFEVPAEKTAAGYLRELCITGLKDRYRDYPERLDQNGELSPEVLTRLDRELDVIEKLGFPNYFLIVWDFVRYARERGIHTTARGSGVGSIVSYALYLSHVCPLQYELLFERFLDENRLEAPDIDIDFDKDRRAEVIQYVKDKYGEANVAQIGTFGTLAARAAIRDVGRALGMPIPRVDAVVAMVPDDLGITLDKALSKSDDLRKACEGDGEIRELIDLARKIEGLARNVGTHAAAVVIADRPLVEYVPLGKVQGKDDVITQWSMGDVEAAGLLKMDFLGLRNLTILAKAVEIIEQTTGKTIDPYRFPMDDSETFALLCRGETKGIFQLESGGIRDLLQKMKPDRFQDIIATNALYRPGPLEGGMVDDYVQVKLGQKKAEYKHTVMEEVLKETHGVMVYQEQVMLILNRLGDIPLSDAYKCIKAISKKKLPIIAKNREDFVTGSVAKGFSKSEAAEIFGLIEKFAGYGFNKSHSTAYANIAYMTAYLKAHFPVEFMAALLSGDIQGRNFKRKDSLVEHLEDCRRMEIEVVPPDVNQSQGDFTVVDNKICFGLTAIKACGLPAAKAICHEREANGPFRDLFDFCERLDPSVVNRSTIETLIKAGAFDGTGARRSQCMGALDRALQSGATKLADRKSGQKSLFDEFDDSQETAATDVFPEMPEWDEREKLAAEKEVLGCYFSSHPLAEHESTLSIFCSHRISQLGEVSHQTEVVLGGMISAIKFSHTKNPRPGAPSKYAMFDLEDMSGIVRCIVWPDVFERQGQLVVPDSILLARGAVDRRPGSDEANLIVQELTPLEQAEQRFTDKVRIRVEEKSDGARRIEQLHEILRGYPGKCSIELLLNFQDGGRMLLKCSRLQIEINEELKRRVDDLLGPGNFRLLARPAIPAAGQNGAKPRRGSRRELQAT